MKYRKCSKNKKAPAGIDLELEQIIAGSIQEECLSLLKQLQEVGSDPVGFGEIVRVKQNEYWKSVNWEEIYKDARFNVDVKLKLESYGELK